MKKKLVEFLVFDGCQDTRELIKKDHRGWNRRRSERSARHLQEIGKAAEMSGEKTDKMLTTVASENSSQKMIVSRAVARSLMVAAFPGEVLEPI